MMKIENINNNSEAFPGCDHKGWDMLLEGFDHLIDDKLSQCIES